MGIYSKLLKQEERAALTASSNGEMADLASLFDPDAITAQQAMSVPCIACAVNIIAGTIASLPVTLYKRNADGVETEAQNDYRVFMLNEDTGDALSASEVKYSLIRDYILTGCSYYYCDWVGNKLSLISYLKPSAVSYSKLGLNIYKKFFFMCDGQKIEPWQMGRILRNTENGAKGKGLVQEQGDYVQLLINIANLLSRTSRQGGKLILQPEARIAQEGLNDLKRAWQNLYGSNSGENAMILNSTVKVNQLDTQVKTEISTVEQYASEQIIAALGIPAKIMMGGASEHDYALFRNNCLVPIIKNMEHSFNRYLLLEREKGKMFFKIDTDALTTSSMYERMQGYTTALNSGVMSLNEVRLKENLNPLDADVFKFSLNSVLWDPTTGTFNNLNMIATNNGEQQTEGGEAENGNQEEQ